MYGLKNVYACCRWGGSQIETKLCHVLPHEWSFLLSFYVEKATMRGQVRREDVQMRCSCEELQESYLYDPTNVVQSAYARLKDAEAGTIVGFRRVQLVVDLRG
jgi:hypothetical protein